MAERGFQNKTVLDITEALYLNEETADVHFIFEANGEKQRVPAHTIILAKGSKVFNAMFFGEIKEKKEVMITDASEEGFTDFLAFFYLASFEPTKESVYEVVYLADKYDVPEGTRICEGFLLKNTSISELCYHLGLANKFNLNQLKEHCAKEIRANAVMAFNSQGFIESQKYDFEFILKLGNHQCNGMDIFNASMAWARNICAKKNIDSSIKQNLRRELDDCFFLIPFTTLTIDNFSEIVSNNDDLFTKNEIIDIVASIASGKQTQLSDKFIKSSIHINCWDEENKLTCAREWDLTQKFLMFKMQYIQFSVNRKSLLGGFKFAEMYRRTDEARTDLCALISVSGCEEDQEKTFTAMHRTFHSFSKTKPLNFEIKLDKPVVLLPDVKYNIVVDLTQNIIDSKGFVEGWSYHGKPVGHECKFHEDFQVTFSRHDKFPYGAHNIVTHLFFNRL